MSYPNPPAYADINKPEGGAPTTQQPTMTQQPTSMPMPQHGYTPASYYQPPPQPMYPPQPQQQATVIITHTRPGIPLGSQSTHVSCPSCQAAILTRVTHDPNPRTHCWALMLCLFGCWPCVCVPYLMDSCKSANHYCPNCSAYIGTFEN